MKFIHVATEVDFPMAIKKLLFLAICHQEPCYGSHSDLLLCAFPDDDINALISSYKSAFHYLELMALGIDNNDKSTTFKQKLSMNQLEVEKCIKELKAIDLNDKKSLLSWLCDYQKSTGKNCLNRKTFWVFDKICQHGYTFKRAKINLPLSDDTDDVANWAIGVALESMAGSFQRVNQDFTKRVFPHYFDLANAS